MESKFGGGGGGREEQLPPLSQTSLAIFSVI